MDYYSFTIPVGKNDPLALRDQLIDYKGKRVIFDLDRVICDKQVRVALSRADIAFEQGTHVATTWGIEVLVHLLGDHQIKKCLDILGIRKETTRIGVVQDDAELDIQNKIDGLNLKKAEQTTIDMYGIPGEDPCIEVISKGVNVIIDHE